jgi:hypothetical protein
MMKVWFTICREAKLKVQLSCLCHAYVGSNMLMWVDCGVCLVFVQVVGHYNGQSLFVAC